MTDPTDPTDSTDPTDPDDPVLAPERTVPAVESGARTSAPIPGRRIITASRVGTAVFTVTATAAVIDKDAFGLVNVIVSLVLFAVGCVVFLWAFGIAVNRSRTDAIGIGGLYFLAGSAPRQVQVALLVPLGVQVGVALVSAGLRPFSSLAFGVLVPMFGLGQAGLWGARYGSFGPRSDGEGPNRAVPPK